MTGTAFTRLAIHPNNRLISTANIGRVYRQISDIPKLFFILYAQTFTNSVLVATRESGIHQFTQPRMARVRFNLRTGFSGGDNFIGNTDIQLRVDALAV